MTDMTPLTARTRVPLADPAGMMDRLCDHMSEHLEVARSGSSAVFTSYYGTTEVRAGAAHLAFDIASPYEERLFVLKSVISEHLHGFAEGETLDFSWEGHGDDSATIPYFREMTVVRSEPVSPRMQRVILTGDAAYYDADNFHIRVLVPPKGRPPVWPTAAIDGRTIWPKGEDELLARVYTIRRVDLARREVAIDVVVHEGAPGSDWAMTAEPGSIVGILGPGGGGLPSAADLNILAGDETALPAIARMLEGLPATARAIVRIEIADMEEVQQLTSPAELDIAWLPRNGAPAGTTDLLETAIREIDWASAPARTHVWCACEQTAARKVRRFLDKECGFAKTDRTAVAYWRLGAANADTSD